MASELVRRLIEANENSAQRALGSDIFYQAAERIEYLEKTLQSIAEPIQAMQNDAEEAGAELNGAMANQLANDPGYLREIARKALRI